ncbi:MAG: AAA family ATPase [Chloroflexota bacterium]|nr:AAA family ATPase [Chloroflexota bacterium]
MNALNFDHEQGAYSVWWDDPPVHMQFDRLRWDRYGALGGEVTVRLLEPVETLVHSAHATLTTTDGRTKLAKHCQTRSPEAGVDWLAMTDAACIRVRDAFRIGKPAIRMENVTDVEPGEAQLRDSLTGDPILPRNELVIAFGDGDTGKSMVALFAAGIMQTGRSDLAGFEVPDGKPIRVGYADWETSAGTQKARLRRMFGEFFPKDMVYIPGAGLSLPDSVDRFRRIIREHRLNYLIIDSIAYACGGPPEDASVASGFLNALQQLGLGKSLGVLAIAHVTKADAKASADKPFGSAFWANSARMTWYMRRNEGHGEQYSVGLFNKKHNLGPRSRSIGLTLDYSDGGLVFGRTDAANDAALAVGERLSLRVHRALIEAKQAMSYAQLADALDADPKVVAETCRRGLGTMFTKVPSEGREVRIGLMTKTLEVA